MTHRPASPKRPRPSLLKGLFFHQLPLETETVRFLLASILDYLMTYVLLYYGHLQQTPLRHTVIESNPVARYFIDHWGLMKGLLGFKLGIVLFVCLTAQVIVRRRPQTAAALLNIGTAVTGTVVVYSLWLFVSALR